MRLKTAQKLAILQWIAEGLKSDEINERAAGFDPPFSVSRMQVEYYRSSRKLYFAAVKKISEETALTEGYALRDHRVYKLSLLAALMERDLLGGILWTEEVKGIGSGDIAEIVDYEEFNKAEVDAYRGVLDDIAREVGGRIQRSELSGPAGGPIPVDPYAGLSDDQLRQLIQNFQIAAAPKK